MKLLKPFAIKPGSTIGIFTPSSPSYHFNEEMFLNGIKNIQKLGFNIKLGFLTEKRAFEGYRAANGKERAKEFMELIVDDNIDAVMSTIGGMNSNSLIPFLDFDLIRKKRKIFSGYSDVTSLHLAILKFSGLKTFYGPALMTWFGEYPNGIQETTDSFYLAATQFIQNERELFPFEKWSNHRRNWENGDWKNIPREWQVNKGWNVLQDGQVQAEIVVANLNTLMCAAGTDYFPDLENKILLIEEMAAPWSRTERSLMQLKLMGVFEKISGLIFGKPEFPDAEGALFSIEDLLLEIIGSQNYPIITQFDCSHTVPMHTIQERCKVEILRGGRIKICESFVENKNN